MTSNRISQYVCQRLYLTNDLKKRSETYNIATEILIGTQINLPLP